jgi:ribose/xylose/arabinose/galactoside ABC-type transport system permease subunit
MTIKTQRGILAFLKNQNIVLFLILIMLNIFFTVMSDHFFQMNNYFNMLKQSSALLITASAATILMMTGNFDLSTGSNLAFSGVLYAQLASNGLPLSLAAAITLMAGTCFGVVNGILVTRYDISPFIATLGMLFVGKGLALVVCNGQSVRSNLPDHFMAMMTESFFGIPLPIMMAIVGVAIFWLLANKSLLGKYAMVIGSNKNAAFLSGINVNAICLWLFIIVAVLASLAGIMTASRIGAGDPRINEFFFMDVIVAIMLGGTSLKGGKGTITGTLIAAMIVIVIGNGLSMLNVLIFWQTIIKGIILILAVIFNEKILIRKIGGKVSRLENDSSNLSFEVIK